MLRTYSRQVRKESPDLSKICRMCLTQFAEMLDIFAAEVEPLTNVSVIRFCVGIDCEEKDGLPSRVCSACYHSLVDFFAFKRMCLSSDLRFKSCRDAAAMKETEASVMVEDNEGKEEVKDELSLAHSNDLGLLETDCVHPGAPDEVLSQIKKSDEEEDCELPLADFHGEQASACVQMPQEERRVQDSQQPLSLPITPLAESPPKRKEPSSDPQKELEGDSEDDDDIDAFLPPSVRAFKQIGRGVSKEKRTPEIENLVGANQSSHNSNLGVGSECLQTVDQPRKGPTSVAEPLVTILATNRIGPLRREEVNLTRTPLDTEVTVPLNQLPEVQNTSQLVTNASAPVKRVIVSLKKPMIGATAPQVAVDPSPETAFKEPQQSDPLAQKAAGEGSKKYSCKECDKQFRTPNSLRRHTKNHGPAEWKCPECGKMFHQITSMKRHQVLHTGRRFACPDCSKVLLSRDGLKCHMRTHHSERKGPEYYKFKCSHCNKCFAHSSGLSRHMAIHKGIHYECELCSKKFNDSSQVKRHRIKHHPTINFESSAGGGSASDKNSSGIRTVSGTDSEGPTSPG